VAGTIDFVSPGGIGIPDTTISLPSRGGRVDLGPLKGHYFPKKVLQSGAGQMFRPKIGPDIQIRITGLNVAAEHYAALDEFLPGMIWSILNEAGELMTAAARRTVPILSGDTYKSIHHFMSTGPGSSTVSVGPTTFYAPLIEYGLGPHARKGPRPFMSNALFEILPGLVLALNELARIAKAGTKFSPRTPEYKSVLQAHMAELRAFLYGAEKLIGDRVILGIRAPGLSKIRAGLLGGARILGDVQSVMGRVVGARITRRLTGKVTGRLIGVGSRTIFVNQSVTAQISGAQRIYNLQAGKFMSRYVSQSGVLSGRRR
jgi:hypothetical protein